MKLSALVLLIARQFCCEIGAMTFIKRPRVTLVMNDVGDGERKPQLLPVSRVWEYTLDSVKWRHGP